MMQVLICQLNTDNKVKHTVTTTDHEPGLQNKTKTLNKTNNVKFYTFVNRTMDECGDASIYEEKKKRQTKCA